MTDRMDAETVRRFAEARGLARAHALSPDAVKTALERGAQPLGSLPAAAGATIEPAIKFTAGGEVGE